MAETRASFDEKNDDLDLSIMLWKIVHFFKINGWLLVVASLTGLFCGIILHVSFQKHYTAKLLMESTVLNNMEQNELIDNWDLMMSRKSVQLQKELGCSPRVAQSILGISAESLPAQPDGTNCFTLTVNVRDTSQLQNIQDALLNGMRNNDYVKQKVAVRQANLENEIGKASGEIDKLDSAKDFIEGLARSDKKENDRLILDVSGISKEKVEIGEKLAGYKERLAFGKGVTVVLGFSAVKGPKPGLLTLIVAGLAGGFLFGYFLAVVKALIRLSKRK